MLRTATLGVNRRDSTCTAVSNAATSSSPPSLTRARILLTNLPALYKSVSREIPGASTSNARKHSDLVDAPISDKSYWIKVQCEPGTLTRGGGDWVRAGF